MALTSSASSEKLPGLPTSHTSLRRLEDHKQWQRKEGDAMKPQGDDEDKGAKKAPRLPPNYVSLRQLRERQQQRMEEEARKTKEEEDRRLEMLKQEAEKAEAERVKQLQQARAGPVWTEDRQPQQQQKGRVRAKKPNQRRWAGWEGKSTWPTRGMQPAGGGQRTDVPAKAAPAPASDPAPVAVSEMQSERSKKTEDTRNRLEGEKRRFWKKNRGGSFDRHSSGKPEARFKGGEAALGTARKADATGVNANPSSEAAAIATKLEGSLTLSPEMELKEEARVSAKSKPRRGPGRKRDGRKDRRGSPIDQAAAGMPEEPLALASATESKQKLQSDKLSETHPGRRNNFKNVLAAKVTEIPVQADEGTGDTGTSPSSISSQVGEESSRAALHKGEGGPRRGGRYGSGHGGRGRYRERSGADAGVVWIRKSLSTERVPARPQ